MNFKLRNETIIAYIFSSIYGYVNAIGFIVMNGLFFTFMSGNSIRLGVNLGNFDLQSNLRLFIVFTALILGIFLSDFLFSTLKKRSIEILILLELLLFIVTLLFSLKYNSWIVFLPLGIAMGVQNMLNLLIGNNLMGKSFITGLIFNFGISLSRLVQGKGSWRLSMKYAFTWFIFVIGAIMGTLVIENFNLFISILLITLGFIYVSIYLLMLLKNELLNIKTYVN